MTTATAQLTLARPGYCVRCGLHRLSVADRDGICCHCEDNAALEARMRAKRQAYKPSVVRVHKGGYDPLPVINGVKYCRCRRGPIGSNGYCSACNSEHHSKYKAKQRSK